MDEGNRTILEPGFDSKATMAGERVALSFAEGECRDGTSIPPTSTIFSVPVIKDLTGFLFVSLKFIYYHIFQKLNCIFA
jgi:hypothetical protein